MSFWQELKRRHVFRVAGVYLAAGWLIAQIVSVIDAPLHLPGWFATVALVLLAIGFPVALLLAWAFDLTPDGVERTLGSDAAGGPGRVSTGRMADFAIIFALAVALGLALWDRRGPEAGQAAAGTEATVASNAIAVLPFANLSSDPEQEYFSDGLSDEISNRLAQIGGLRIAGRTSSALFKNRGADFRTIGDTLGVDHVLEGSVRKAGNELRITAELINVTDGLHVWSTTYERELRDVFAIQEEIAEAVAAALSLTLGIERAGARYAGTESFEAFDHFLHGRPYWQSDPQRAIDEMTKATEVDPGYAQPWAWMSLAYGILAQKTGSPDEFESMERSARRAVELGPNTWESHNALVWALFAKRDWLGANRSFRRAASLAEEAHAQMGFEYASYLETLGRMEAATKYLLGLRDSDPLNREVSLFLQNALVISGRYDEAAEEQRRIGGRSEDLLFLPVYGFPWYLQRGDTETVRTALSRAPEGTVGRTFAAVFDSRKGAFATIRAWLDSPAFKTRAELALMSHYAGYYGDTELTVRLLREAYLSDGWGSYFLMWDPTLSAARRTPAFEDFLRDLGFVELWRETGEWNDYCHPTGPDAFQCR